MDMAINSDIVRQLRAKANWSQEDLAAASGLSLRTVQRVENDGSAGLQTRKALAAAFRVRPEELDLIGSGYGPQEVRIGTGALVIWVGVAWFFKLGIAIGLIGVGVIYLAGQAMRWLVARQPLLWELVALGVVFLMAGVTALMGFDINLAPVLLIALGCLIMFSRRRT